MAESDKTAATESSAPVSSSDELINELDARLSEDEQNQVKGGAVNAFISFFDKADGGSSR